MVLRAQASARARALRSSEAKRKALETWEYERYVKPCWHTWRAHFPSMRLKYTFIATDGPGADSNNEYLLRRNRSGTWDMQLTHESWAKETKELREKVSAKATSGRAGGPAPFYQEAVEQLRDLGDGPSWARVPDDLGPAMEVAYQRYIVSAT
jgi:hypothetical protein